MQKSKMEFSKKLFIMIAIFNCIITAFTLVMVWRTLDLSPLSYLIPACFAEFATATGFYYSKAKAENKIKLMKSEGVPITSEDFNEKGEY